MSLFKFQPCNENSKRALLNYSSWFSSPIKFNDPFEGLYEESIKPVDSKGLIELVTALWNNNAFKTMCRGNGCETIDEYMLKVFAFGRDDEFKTILVNIAKDILENQRQDFLKSGISCFITKSDEYDVISESLMWGHYGDGLRGFALELDSAEMELGTNNPLIFRDDDVFSFKVEYREKPLMLNPVELMRMSCSGDASSKFDVGMILGSIMCSKSKEWRYENEVRYINYHKQELLLRYREGSIRRIFIGDKMSDEDKSEMLSIANEIGVKEIYEAYALKNEYKVAIRLISSSL